MDAEKQYRLALERLKVGKPAILEKGALITQNNVAREAGKDPSALRKSRYPSLVAEIQKEISARVAANPPSQRQIQRSRRKRSRTMLEQLTTVIAERDKLGSMLSAADAYILELHGELESLRICSPNSSPCSLDNPRKSKLK